MADPTGWKIRVRQLSWIQHVFDVAGSAGWALALIAGLSIVTALIGFFTEHPSVAITLGVVVAYYGFRLFERAHLWWRREAVDTKITFDPMTPIIVASDEAQGICTITVAYKITNHAPFDVVYVEDDEDFWVGDCHAENTPLAPPDIFPPGRSAIRGSTIKIPINRHDRACGKLTFRCGKNRKALNVRRFVAFEATLPRQIALSKDMQDGFRITRNDTEWVLD